MKTQHHLSDITFKTTDTYTLGRPQLHQINDCSACKYCQPIKTIGRGTLPCDLMVVGEAPGVQEDTFKSPFVGPCGDLVNLMLEKFKGTVFLSNVVLCTPKNQATGHIGTPGQTCVDACMKNIHTLIRLGNPKFILFLGSVARDSVTRNARFYAILRESVPYSSHFLEHPGYVLREGTLSSAMASWKRRFRQFLTNFNSELEK